MVCHCGEAVIRAGDEGNAIKINCENKAGSAGNEQIFRAAGKCR